MDNSLWQAERVKKKLLVGWEGGEKLASLADVVRGSARVPVPLYTTAETRGKKRRPITAHFKIWEVHFGPWEISRETSEKIRTERSREWLEQTAQLTHPPSNRETCTKSQNISATFLSGAKLFGHVSHSTELVHCVWLVNTLTSIALIVVLLVSCLALLHNHCYSSHDEVKAGHFDLAGSWTSRNKNAVFSTKFKFIANCKC